MKAPAMGTRIYINHWLNFAQTVVQNSHSGLPYLGLPYHDPIPMVHLSIARYANPHTPLERAQCCSMSCHPAYGLVRQGHGEVRSELNSNRCAVMRQPHTKRGANLDKVWGVAQSKSSTGAPCQNLQAGKTKTPPRLKYYSYREQRNRPSACLGGCGTKQKLHGRWVRQGHDGHAASLEGSGSPGGRHQLSSSIRIVKTFTQTCQMGAGCPHKPKLEEHTVD